MPHPNQPVAVRHPEARDMIVVLDPGVDYPADDALVSAYPHFFTAREAMPGIVESVSVEAATAAPGEKRNRSRK